jgi:hypothetical protein
MLYLPLKTKSMLRYILLFISGFTIFTVSAQEDKIQEDLIMVKGLYLGISTPDLIAIPESNVPATDDYFEIENFKDRNRVSPVERNLYPRIDPLWNPNLEISNQRVPNSTLLQSFNGISYSNVNPPDPCVAAGSQHVVQMVNGSGGAIYNVYDKVGNSLTGNLSFDNLFSGYSGLGDPIVMYDQLAERWLLSEFSSSGNRLLIAISTTDNPMGNFHTYVFQAVNFPDYPKYAVWPNAYYCTSNENTSAIYAFERDSMLIGAPANMVRQSINDLSGYGFQTLTPMTFDGTTLPAVPSPATFWRHVDDEAHYPGNADPFSDQLEYWEFTPDFSSVANSVLVGSKTISVTDFDSDLNGYFSFSAITQKGSSIQLDPLREVLMNRMNYRNFGLYESMVACHVTDVNGNDRAGIRWYEFRKTSTTDWALYQEGTYSPTIENRWMASIEINSMGSICLAYSVAGDNTFPSLRYTGRNVSDSSGMMTLPEQTIVNGTAANQSNRYGDYAAMTIDPADDSTFWFTGEYNPSSTWGTRIAHIQLSDTCGGLTGTTAVTGSFTCPGDANGQVMVQAIGGTNPIYTYKLDQGNFQNSNSFSQLTLGTHSVFIRSGNCTAEVPFFLTGPDTFSFQKTVTAASCNGNADGVIVLTAMGGTGNLTFSNDSINWTSNNIFASLTAGFYTFYVRDDSNCVGKSIPFEMTEPAELLVSDSVTSTTTNVSNDGSIVLHAVGGNPPYQYSLDNITYQTDSIYTGLISGLYSIYVKDIYGCKYTGQVNLKVTSVYDVIVNDGISIYPNPTENIFNVVLTQTSSHQEINFKVTDISGKTIIEKNIKPSRSRINVPFDLSQHAKGVYILNISDQNSTHTFKVILK